MSDPHPSVTHLTRRGLLRAGAAVGLGGASVLASAGPAAAVRTLPNSSRFDLTDASTTQFFKKDLHANWVLQSLGFDVKNQHIYFLQTQTGSTNGNLWVTKTSVAGTELGSMFLTGFGHGVSIGVDPVGADVYLWTEWKAAASGYGTRVGRFKFVNGGTLSATSTAVQDRTPVVGVGITNPQPVVDPSTDRLIIRYKTTVGAYLAVYPMSVARARIPTSSDLLAEIRPLPSFTPSFQGFAVYGRYAYLIDGNSDDVSSITSVDINTPSQPYVDRQVTNAGTSLTGFGREPEGMAIWTTSSLTVPRLAFGIYSNTGGVRQASVFYKDRLI